MESRPPVPDGSVPAIYLVAIDEGPLKLTVLDMACGLGAALGGPAELHILHVSGVVPPRTTSASDSERSLSDALDGGRRALADASAHARERFHGNVLIHLEGGQPWRTIIQMASSLHADLVVVGTSRHARSLTSPVASVADEVMRHAGCPVLVVRPKDYESYAGPGIEPACLDCIAIRKETARARLWCEQHSTHHPSAILHYESAPAFAAGSSILRP